MLNIANIFKAIVICAVIIALNTLYTTSAELQKTLVAEGQDVSKIEALSYYLSYLDVWFGMFSSWVSGLFLSLTVCLLLLLWIKK